VSVTPLAISSEPLPEATVAVALVELTGAADHGSAARRTATGTPRVEIGDREIRVTWSDGAVDIVPADGHVG
jgi:hypothetical protein